MCDKKSENLWILVTTFLRNIRLIPSAIKSIKLYYYSLLTIPVVKCKPEIFCPLLIMKAQIVCFTEPTAQRLLQK